MGYAYPPGEATGKEAQTRYVKYAVDFDYWIPFCWVGLVVCLFAIVTSYAFKKQRQFPASVAIWTLWLDFLKYIRELTKWSPIPSVQEEMVYHQTQATCSFAFIMNNLYDTGEAIVNIEIALIVYLCVVKKIDMGYDADKRWFWGFVIALWVYMIGISIPFGLSTEYAHIYRGGCPSSIPGMYVYLLVQWVVVVIITSILIGMSLKYIRQVMNSTKTEKTSPTKKLSTLIHVRFIFILLVQTIPHFIDNVDFLYSVYPGYSEKVSVGLVNTVTYMLPIFFLADSLIVIAWNRQLRKWVTGRLRRLYGSISPKNSKDSSSPTSGEDLEGLQLPTLTSDTSSSLL